MKGGRENSLILMVEESSERASGASVHAGFRLFGSGRSTWYWQHNVNFKIIVKYMIRTCYLLLNNRDLKVLTYVISCQKISFMVVCDVAVRLTSPSL